MKAHGWAIRVDLRRFAPKIARASAQTEWFVSLMPAVSV
jgi:hypothetical protein